jgi:hypothetical protein
MVPSGFIALDTFGRYDWSGSAIISKIVGVSAVNADIKLGVKKVSEVTTK